MRKSRESYIKEIYIERKKKSEEGREQRGERKEGFLTFSPSAVVEVFKKEESKRGKLRSCRRSMQVLLLHACRRIKRN